MKYFLLILSLTVNLFSLPHEVKYVKDDPFQTDFNVLTIPKAGSYLLNKCLILIIDRHFKNTNQIRTYCLNHCDDPFLIWKDEHGKKYINKIVEQKLILMIRDFRDICVSLNFWINSRDRLGSHLGLNIPENVKDFWMKMSWDEKLMVLINGDYDFIPLNHVIIQSQRALFWDNTPNTYVCKFENLIGPKGLGDRDLQINEINNIVNFLELELTNEEIIYVADHLFGNEVFSTSTFRQGKQGQWKNYFQSNHIEAFKNKLNQYLIYFGYEEGEAW